MTRKGLPAPSVRTIALPHEDRDSLAAAIAEPLLEIRSWPEEWAIGESSHLALETEIDGKVFYVEFLSSPDERGVLCEIASGFHANGSGFSATPSQRDAMVSHGFSDGLEGNFRKELVFDAPDAARTIVDETLALIGSVLGWSAESRITAKVTHGQRTGVATVFDGLSPSDLVELLTRHGIEATVPRRRESPSEGLMVEASIGGRAFAIHLANRVESTPRHRLIAARARVGKSIDPAAANPFNALTGLGRSWVSGGDAYVEASLRVAGLTEDAFHHWLAGWSVALATADYWYRRVTLNAGLELSLESRHFDEHFHNLQRIARSHVKPRAEEAAIDALIAEVRAREPSATGQVDAWSFFESYAAANPTQAMPIEERFVSSATPADLVSWLERIDGVESEVASSGDLDVSHVVPGGTLRLAPGAVRRIALSQERFAVALTLDAEGGAREVVIGTHDFYFAPEEAQIALEGIDFVVDDMPAFVSWFETRLRLRSLEREIAWAGALPCGGSLAWLRGALAGAERVGLACEAERARFDRVLEGVERAGAQKAR